MKKKEAYSVRYGKMTLSSVSAADSERKSFLLSSQDTPSTPFSSLWEKSIPPADLFPDVSIETPPKRHQHPRRR